LENAKYLLKFWGWGESIAGSTLLRMVLVGVAAAVMYSCDKKRTEEVTSLQERVTFLEEKMPEIIEGAVKKGVEAELKRFFMYHKQDGFTPQPAFGPSGN